MFICLFALPCIPGFERVALVAQLVERSPRTWSVVGSSSTQGSFFFEKRESCPGCISLPCLIVMYNAYACTCVYSKCTRVDG